MPELTIDAAVEQVVKTSGDRDALTEAARVLAGLLGFDLVPKAPVPLHVGDRVRLLRDLPGIKAGTCGEVIDLPFGDTVDALFDGQPYPMLCGRDDIEPVVEQDDEAGYETDPDPKPRDGEHGTCAVCGGEIHYWEATVWNGVEDDVIDTHWSHVQHPADGHDAEIGGPA